MRRNLLVILLLGVCAIGYAQQRQISGKVVDDAGEPVPGANVIVKGTTEGTTTYLDCKYRITVPERSDALINSFIAL
ncbi:MAG: carboxypeptidase-like regulatory domain-containing protein [Cyclobacteriaceae bacterium]